MMHRLRLSTYIISSPLETGTYSSRAVLLHDTVIGVYTWLYHFRSGVTFRTYQDFTHVVDQSPLDLRRTRRRRGTP